MLTSAIAPLTNQPRPLSYICGSATTQQHLARFPPLNAPVSAIALVSDAMYAYERDRPLQVNLAPLSYIYTGATTQQHLARFPLHRAYEENSPVRGDRACK